MKASEDGGHRKGRVQKTELGVGCQVSLRGKGEHTPAAALTNVVCRDGIGIQREGQEWNHDPCDVPTQKMGTAEKGPQSVCIRGLSRRGASTRKV